MPKGYWIANNIVHDLEGYKAYQRANAVPFEKYGARFLVRGGRFEAPEGTARDRNVVVQFADYETARACYASPEYAAARQIRMANAEADFLIVEGT